MGVMLFIFSLLLIQSAYSQIDTPEDARRVACSLAVRGLTGDPQCALSAARLNLASQGINQSLAIDDLNELCTSTPCAQLIDLQLETICEDEGGSANFSFRQKQLLELSCTVDNTTRSCVEFISSPQFKALNMSAFMQGSSCQMSNITEGGMCLPECAMMLVDFVNSAGCCSQEILNYFEAIDIFPAANTILSACGVEDIPNNCRRYEEMSSNSFATRGSIGILSLIVAAVFVLN